tara:strand:- start:994 stop:1512 length:519 start_codon:yes stop_codon:yes gene_type:complete
MKAVLIDPFEPRISDVEIKDDHLLSYYSLIGCTTVTAIDAEYNGKPASLFLDDEGLFKNDQKFWHFPQHQEPLAGKAVLVGFDPSTGESLDAPIDAQGIIESGLVLYPNPTSAVGSLLNYKPIKELVALLKEAKKANPNFLPHFLNYPIPIKIKSFSHNELNNLETSFSAPE